MESKTRTMIKALSYRGLVTAILATIGYYWHDRIWNKIAWGTKKNNARVKISDAFTLDILESGESHTKIV